MSRDLRTPDDRGSIQPPSLKGVGAEVAPLLRLALPIVAGLAASTLIGVVDTVMISPQWGSRPRIGTVRRMRTGSPPACVPVFSLRWRPG